MVLGQGGGGTSPPGGGSEAYHSLNPPINKKPFLIHGRSALGSSGFLIHGGFLFMGVGFFWAEMTKYRVKIKFSAPVAPKVSYSWGFLIHGCRVKIGQKFLIHGGFL